MTEPHTSSPYLSQPRGVSNIMQRVLLALLPGILVYAYFFGWHIIINIGIASITALISEAIMLKIRERPLAPYLQDYSALVTAWLLALALPTLAPWWLIVIATLFAIVVAKQLYGGLGYNPFNPAMIGYVVVMISFPQQMTLWGAPFTEMGLMDALQYHFTGHLADPLTIDSITAATPIDRIKTGLTLNQTVDTISQSSLFGAWGGVGWEWIAGTFLLGGLWLLFTGIISWHIPLAMITVLVVMAGIFHLTNPAHYPSPLFHLFNGGTLLAAFFIATDPVSASTTPRGRLIYAGGIGLLTYIIRTWGGYPDGIAFAVLLMNMAVPLIDQYTQPRVFGSRS
jgi:electron transport complex protein RnfD